MFSDTFIKNAGTKRLLVISGSGLSAESGSDDFREAEDAVWEGINVNDVCNIASFYRKYHKVHAFYNTLRVLLGKKDPNTAHYAIAELQKMYNDRFLHITANWDDLYERAGGTAMHLHGNLTEVIEGYSVANNDYKVLQVGYEPYIPTEGVDSKPNIVLLGETERYVNGVRTDLYAERNAVLQSLTEHDTVVIIGSSNTILKWSDLVGVDSPAYTINVNTKKNEDDWVFDKKIYLPITKAIPELVSTIEDRMK